MASKGYRRVAEDRWGSLPPWVDVHHIDGNHGNNRGNNLAPVTKSVHWRLTHVDSQACFRCGRSGHWANDCYAQRQFNGRGIWRERR